MHCLVRTYPYVVAVVLVWGLSHPIALCEGGLRTGGDYHTASDLMAAHFRDVFDTERILLTSRSPVDAGTGLRFLGVGTSASVTVSYGGRRMVAMLEAPFPELVDGGILTINWPAREKDGNASAMLELRRPRKDISPRLRVRAILDVLAGTDFPTSASRTSVGEKSLGARLHDAIRQLKAMHHSLNPSWKELWEEGVKPRDAFDAQSTFAAFGHLRMEEGYVFDYVYRNWQIGGAPVLYARGGKAKPHRKVDELAKAYGVDLKQWRLADDSCGKRYLDHVRVDGTDMGWLELVALYLLGDQFYLFWHANYNDTLVISDERAWVSVDREKPVTWGVPEVVMRLARTLDLEPTVRVSDDLVFVSLVTFTSWGGFEERRFAISKAFPHRVQEETRRPLIRYECGIMF